VDILFVTATRIGDAVLSTGLLDHLLRSHPAARFTIACGPVAEGVFARMPRREQTILLQRQPGRWHWFDLWRAVAGRRWGLVVDCRASAIAYLLRTRRRVVVPGGRRPEHRVLLLGRAMGLAPPPLPVAWMAPEDHARAAVLLPTAGPVLAIGPTANWPKKVWPADRFVALVRALTGPGGTLAGARVAVLGGPGPEERAMAAPVLAALGPAAIDLIGGLALPEVAAVIARSALFIGNDSGLMHLAAATGTPTLGLFGPSSVEQYGPAGRRAAAAAAPASPALESMPGLTLATALGAADALLAAPPVETWRPVRPFAEAA
jgi:hypothetical protein